MSLVVVNIGVEGSSLEAERKRSKWIQVASSRLRGSSLTPLSPWRVVMVPTSIPDRHWLHGPLPMEACHDPSQP